MEQSASAETTTHAIPAFLWNPQIRCRLHNSPPLDPVLSHMDPIHIIIPCFFKVHFNSISSRVVAGIKE
jgi:hypothetical protein